MIGCTKKPARSLVRRLRRRCPERNGTTTGTARMGNTYSAVQLLMGGAAALCLVVILGTVIAGPARAHAPRDSDGDGIPDEVERRTGTDPFSDDTDSDGVRDGVEDANRDGIVDVGESDPRRAGLFPGTAPHIPEPLNFDLVRGLGARRGELEINTLAVVRLGDGQVGWAPEVEWAFADGYAVELELPLDDRHLEAVKLALQGTLPGSQGNFVHGWQTYAEIGLDEGVTESVALYILGQRLSHQLSYLLMAGGRTVIGESGVDADAFLLNASLFWDSHEWQTRGFETNLEVGDGGEWILRLFPQIHLQLSESVRLQFSVGADVTADGADPTMGLRAILE